MKIMVETSARHVHVTKSTLAALFGEGYQLRNAILVGLAYTMTGMLIRKYEKKILGVQFLAPALWILLAVCGTTAIFELNGYKQGVAVPFVSCEILTVVIVLLCLRYPNFLAGTSAENLGRDCSLPVYIMHIAVMCALLLFIPENGMASKRLLL